MKVSRDVLVVVVLFAVLVVVVGYGASRRVEAETRYLPGSIKSAQPDGGRAFYLWLREMGYPTTVVEGATFAIDRDIKLLLLLAPYTEARIGFLRTTISVTLIITLGVMLLTMYFMHTSLLTPLRALLG